LLNLKKEVTAMNWLKFILLMCGLLFAGMIVLSVIGVIYSALFYIFILGAVGIAGYVGYKLISKDAALELESRDPIAKIELDNAERIKSLEDYKRKYLK
jgi:amino acid permease